MLILVLINVQYIQNVVLSFKNASSSQNHSSSDSQPITHISKICVILHEYELFRIGSCSFELVTGEIGGGG